MAVQLCVTFPFGTLVRLSAVFRRPPTDAEIADGTAADADDWQKVDPGTVSAKVRDPLDNVDQYDYLGSPSGELVRDGVGEYHLDLTPELAGTWFYRFWGTGDGQSADEDKFKVATTSFP